VASWFVENPWTCERVVVGHPRHAGRRPEGTKHRRLCGGSTKTPKLRNFVASWFAGSRGPVRELRGFVVVENPWTLRTCRGGSPTPRREETRRHETPEGSAGAQQRPQSFGTSWLRGLPEAVDL